MGVCKYVEWPRREQAAVTRAIDSCGGRRVSDLRCRVAAERREGGGEREGEGVSVVVGWLAGEYRVIIARPTCRQHKSM